LVAAFALGLGLAATALVAAVAMMTVVPGILFGLLLSSGCGDVLGPIIASPNPKSGYVAQVRSRVCGAISGWNTYVVCSEQHSFGIDQEPTSAEIAMGNVNPRDVILEWTDDREITITNANPFASRSPDKIEYWDDLLIIIIVVPDPLRPAN
jgi:hypothetical protein